mgnify:CR=1 FL=1
MKKMVAVSETEAYAIARFANEACYRYMKEGNFVLLEEAQEMREQYQEIARYLNRLHSERTVTA